MKYRTAHWLEAEVGFVEIFGFPHARRELEFAVVLVRPGVIWTDKTKLGTFTHLTWKHLLHHYHESYDSLRGEAFTSDCLVIFVKKAIIRMTNR